ncbi:LysR family transcriptional regulator [Pseudoalteromonas fenneropenaei]|uniref:LysR family transcriptional regulator n=1 Tax=Pseudoalteromonas fenneropenaei TaxID=1737459 RepID=A0ABV7CG19_9GAMM
MLSLPPLSALRCFEAAARHLSFKLAADELCISPTAVSHQIRNLESHLGCTLFIRHTRAVTLTAAGQTLAQSAQQAFSQLSNAVQTIQHAANQVTVATTHAFASLWLVPKLLEFQQRYPDIRVKLCADDKLNDLALDTSLDCIIRYGSFDATSKSTLLTREKIGLFATPAVVAQINTTGQLKVYTTQWKNPQLPVWPAEELLAAQFGARWQLYYFSDEQQAVQAALHDQGLFFGSELLVAGYITQGWLSAVTVCPLQLGFAYSLLTRKNYTSTAVETFQLWLQQQFQTSDDSAT